MLDLKVFSYTLLKLSKMSYNIFHEFLGDNSKAPASTIDTKLNGVKQNSLEKRKAADDTQAGVSLK